MRHTTQAGIDLIKHFEGCRLQAYQDSVGVWTIGYGSTAGVHAGQTVTATGAETLLKRDLTTAERSVLRLITVPLTDGQFGALVSFVFNLGGGKLQASTLRRKVNRGESAAGEFSKWVYAGGVRLPGLIKRRAAEAALFLT